MITYSFVHAVLPQSPLIFWYVTQTLYAVPGFHTEADYLTRIRVYNTITKYSIIIVLSLNTMTFVHPIALISTKPY